MSPSNKWERLRRILTNTQPCKQNRAIEVDHEICSTLIDIPAEGGTTNRKVTLFSMEYEQKNIPVKITGATDGWTCMPRYNGDGSKSTSNFSEPFRSYFDGGGKGGWT